VVDVCNFVALQYSLQKRVTKSYFLLDTNFGKVYIFFAIHLFIYLFFFSVAHHLKMTFKVKHTGFDVAPFNFSYTVEQYYQLKYNM